MFQMNKKIAQKTKRLMAGLLTAAVVLTPSVGIAGHADGGKAPEVYDVTITSPQDGHNNGNNSATTEYQDAQPIDTIGETVVVTQPITVPITYKIESKNKSKKATANLTFYPKIKVTKWTGEGTVVLKKPINSKISLEYKVKKPASSDASSSKTTDAEEVLFETPSKEMAIGKKDLRNEGNEYEGSFVQKYASWMAVEYETPDGDDESVPTVKFTDKKNADGSYDFSNDMKVGTNVKNNGKNSENPGNIVTAPSKTSLTGHMGFTTPGTYRMACSFYGDQYYMRKVSWDQKTLITMMNGESKALATASVMDGDANVISKVVEDYYNGSTYFKYTVKENPDCKKTDGANTNVGCMTITNVSIDGGHKIKKFNSNSKDSDKLKDEYESIGTSLDDDLIDDSDESLLQFGDDNDIEITESEEEDAGESSDGVEECSEDDFDCDFDDLDWEDDDEE